MIPFSGAGPSITGESVQVYRNTLDLSAAFTEGVGYHSPCWVDLSSGSLVVDREVPAPLRAFLEEVNQIVHKDDLANGCRIGCAYMRVIDGGSPENYMKWHIDNQDGATRFHTAISTDGARVNLAWPAEELVGRKVTDTEWQSAMQPGNGEICVFTTEPHGVLPQPDRTGELTAIFFATLYPNRAAADLYATNNTSTGSHAMLPGLEKTRDLA